MQTVKMDVQGRIFALVNAILEQNSVTAEVDPESRLVDAGLTSMDMVNLMFGVEAEFDMTIPQSEITPENFQSIKTLELMIVNQLIRRLLDLNRYGRACVASADFRQAAVVVASDSAAWMAASLFSRAAIVPFKLSRRAARDLASVGYATCVGLNTRARSSSAAISQSSNWTVQSRSTIAVLICSASRRAFSDPIPN